MATLTAPPPRPRPELPDGFAIRPVRPADAAGLTAFYAGLSLDSRGRRFLAARRGISEVEALTYATADHEHREGLVATGPPAGTIVAHLCLEPVAPGHLEFAIAVADPLQHHHLGLALLRAGVAWAEAHGIRTLEATTRADNGSMLALARALGGPLRIGTGSGGVVPFSLDLRPRR